MLEIYKNNLKGIYIRNIEGVDAYRLLAGEKTKLTNNWTGYIPYSLELLKLQREGLELYKVKTNKVKTEEGIKYENNPVIRKLKMKDFFSGENNKTLDVVNVNFRCAYSNDEILKDDKNYKAINVKINDINTEKKALTKEISSIKSKIKRKKYKDKLKELNENLEKSIKDRQNKELEIMDQKSEINKLKIKITRKDLREQLYKNGFADENGIKFVLYKRSGSKSRKGRTMFIREELADVMLNWSKMNIDFGTEEIDAVSLAAYCSLVSSTIEDVIKISCNNMLIIDDIESVWEQDAKLIVKGADGHLTVKEGNMELTSCCTDGSSLLDSELFKDGEDFKLLRNHFFKSCSFKCNLKKYYQDYCNKHGYDYDTYAVPDKFGNKILVKNIKIIFSPNSLKALKFSQYVSGSKDKKIQERDMYKYWKQQVKRDCNVFGVCKHNHESKWQFEGKSYQQVSYQILNSLPLDEGMLNDITTWERNYVNRLKNDINVFKDYLKLKASKINCNEAMVAILDKSPKFKNTELFRTFRTKTINKYVDKLKSGKIKNIADNCTMVSNPMCYLRTSVGEYNENDLELKDNQVCTKLFSDKEELVLFRNPHTSQANVYVGINTYILDIDTYFDFGKNIVVVNSIKNPICQILSSADWDSDFCYVTNQSSLVSAGKECYGHYKVCENGIDKATKKYVYNADSMCKIDDKLSNSKYQIGRIVNIGQLAMSLFWNKKSKGAKVEELKALQEIIDIMTILSCVAIDNAKRTYDIDIDAEMEYIVSKLHITKKPKFWRYVSEDKHLKTAEGRENRLVKYNTPMDLLAEVLDKNIAQSDNDDEYIDLKSLFIDSLNKNDANRKQQNEIISIVTALDKSISTLMENKTKDNEEESYKEINKVYGKVEKKLMKKTIKADTIYSFMLLINEEGQEEKIKNVRKIKDRLINLLYRKSPENFLSIFK